MRTALAVSILFALSLFLTAQTKTQVAASTPRPAAGQAPIQPPAPALNAIVAELQKTVESANLDLGKLRIEKWKAGDTERQQMQQVAMSLQKNIKFAIPGLINDVQAAPGSVAKAFKLYHDLNVVYEYLNSLSEAAGAYGKKEEYGPLANDASGLDNARQDLSTYIEQTANTLEEKLRQPVVAQQPQPTTQAPKKIVIDDDAAPAKKTKKKKSASPPSSSTSSPPQ